MKASLFIEIALPKTFTDEVELECNAAKINLYGVESKIQLDCNSDTVITCDSLPTSLEINQIGKTSTLIIPQNVDYRVKAIGKNTVRFAQTDRSNPNSANVIELAGRNSELLIDERG